MRGRLAVLAAIASLIEPVPLAAGAAAAAGWTVVPSPNVNADAHHLAAVSADAGDDAWAVGYYRNHAGAFQTLTQHWNGTAWADVASPDVPGGGNFLAGVTAISPTDAWAVGSYYTAAFQLRPLLEHWDGARWTLVANPPAGAGDVALQGVAARSATDVWAVGGGTQPLIEHWNGSAWSISATPAVAADSATLSSVTVRSESSVWAVGHSRTGYGAANALALRWDGQSWAVQATPTIDSTLTGVVSVGTGVWAVGGQARSTKTLAERWAPPAWRTVGTPTPATTSLLTGTTARSGSDVWAVGTQYSSPQTLIEHWSGTRWTVVTSPSLGLVSLLAGVTAAPDGTLWAVGGYYPRPGAQEQTLILRQTG